MEDPTAPTRAPWRRTGHLDTRGQRRFDLAMTGLLLLPVVLPGLLGSPPSWVVLGLAQIGPLLWRRSRPLAVFTAVAVASALQVLAIGEPIWGQVAFPVATYSVARYSRALPGLAALAVGVVAAMVASIDWLGVYSEDLRATTVGAYFLPITAIVVAAWALGTLGRTRRAYVDTLVERGERIQREAVQQVALAASDERARIAREMHDVVAHGLTVMVVQADGARYAAARDPDVAAATLERIAVTGREALTDMRQLLGLLRDEPGASGRTPLPGLADLPALVTGAGAVAELEGLDREVSTALGLTTYRIVQESLTNVRKHAGPTARATVRVVVGEDAVQVHVEDDGRGAASGEDRDGHGPGHGLLGMRERVDVHGGTLSIGPRPGGGFLVAARLPR